MRTTINVRLGHIHSVLDREVCSNYSLAVGFQLNTLKHIKRSQGLRVVLSYA